MKLENLDMAIEAIKGAAAALDLVSSDLAELEGTTLFQTLTPHNLDIIAADVNSYIEALENVKTFADNNGGELPVDNDPTIKQQLRSASMIGQGYGDGDEEFKTASNDVFGYNFM